MDDWQCDVVDFVVASCTDRLVKGARELEAVVELQNNFKLKTLRISKNSSNLTWNNRRRCNWSFLLVMCLHMFHQSLSTKEKFVTNQAAGGVRSAN